MADPNKVLALRQIHWLHMKTGRPFQEIIVFFSKIVKKLLDNPQVAELLRFIFLGTVVEASRLVGQRIVDMISKCKRY